ncbi:MAG: hypothetical protein ABSA33_06015, partial [Candidatus Micrarchaeaceae archaeon]
GLHEIHEGTLVDEQTALGLQDNFAGYNLSAQKMVNKYNRMRQEGKNLNPMGLAFQQMLVNRGDIQQNADGNWVVKNDVKIRAQMMPENEVGKINYEETSIHELKHLYFDLHKEYSDGIKSFLSRSDMRDLMKTFEAIMRVQGYDKNKFKVQENGQPTEGLATEANSFLSDLPVLRRQFEYLKKTSPEEIIHDYALADRQKMEDLLMIKKDFVGEKSKPQWDNIENMLKKAFRDELAKPPANANAAMLTATIPPQAVSPAWSQAAKLETMSEDALRNYHRALGLADNIAQIEAYEQALQRAVESAGQLESAGRQALMNAMMARILKWIFKPVSAQDILNYNPNAETLSIKASMLPKQYIKDMQTILSWCNPEDLQGLNIASLPAWHPVAIIPQLILGGMH